MWKIPHLEFVVVAREHDSRGGENILNQYGYLKNKMRDDFIHDTLMHITDAT
jgi:hypothetical protein